jgi:hypothetical protein
MNVHLRPFARFSGLFSLLCLALPVAAQAPFQATMLDLDFDSSRQIVVDREAGQYLGHPTTVLLEDGRTILCVYPKGHGRGSIVYKRSTDGGLTWSQRLPTPPNWATSQEVPTIHRVIDASGRKRLIVWSGLYPARLALSEDDGANWSELTPAGEWGGIVVMGSVLPLKAPGSYLGLFHDDGRFFASQPNVRNPVRLFTLYKSLSTDGGRTWSFPEAIQRDDAVHLCEPGAVRSSDGGQIAVLLRENRRLKNAHLIVSRDDGKTWSSPRELPNELAGDRHTAVCAPDGRLFISFRDVSPKSWSSPTRGDWVAWVGTFDDLIQGKPGQYRVRLKANQKDLDCAYPGVECLPDGTIVTTTYGHWVKGEQPYILSVRLKLSELDAQARRQVSSFTR